MAIAKMGVRTFHLIYYILFTLCWTPYVYHATIRLIFLFFLFNNTGKGNRIWSELEQ